MLSGKNLIFITPENIQYKRLKQLNKNENKVSIETNCKFQGETRGALNYLTGLSGFFPDPNAGATVSKYYSTRPVEIVNEILTEALKDLDLANPTKIEDEFLQHPTTKEISYIIRIGNFVKTTKKKNENNPSNLFEATFRLTENGYEFLRLRCSPSSYQPTIEKVLVPKPLEILKKVDALTLGELQDISTLQKSVLTLAKETTNKITDTKIAQQVFATKFLALLPPNIRSIIHDISVLVRQSKHEELAERKDKKLKELQSMKATQKEIDHALSTLEKELAGTEELHATIQSKLPLKLKNLSVKRSTLLSLLYECFDSLRTAVKNETKADQQIKDLIDKVVHEQFATPIYAIYSAVGLKRRNKRIKNAKSLNSEVNTLEIEEKDAKEEEAYYAKLNNALLGFPHVQNDIQQYLEKLKKTWPLNDKNKIEVEEWCESTRGEANVSDYLTEASASFLKKMTQFEAYKKELSQSKDILDPAFYADLNAAIANVIKETELRRDAFVAYTIQLAQERVDAEERKIQEDRYKIIIFNVHKIEKEVMYLIEELDEAWPIDKMSGEADGEKWLKDAIYLDETTTALWYVNQAISTIQQKFEELKTYEIKLLTLKNILDPGRYELASEKISAGIKEAELRLRSFENLHAKLLAEEQTVKSIQSYWEKYAETLKGDLDNTKTIDEIKIVLKQLQEKQIQLAQDLKKLNPTIAELNDPKLRETFNRRLDEVNLSIASNIELVQEILQKKIKEENERETLRHQEEITRLVSGFNKIKADAEFKSKREEEINISRQTVNESLLQWSHIATAATSFNPENLDGALNFLEKNESWKINIVNDKKFIIDSQMGEDFKINAIGKIDASYSIILTTVLNIQTEVMNEMNRLAKNLSDTSLEIAEVDNEIRKTAQYLSRIDDVDIVETKFEDFFAEQDQIINGLNRLQTMRSELEEKVFSDKENLSDALERLNSIEWDDEVFISYQKKAEAILNEFNSQDISPTIENVKAIIEHNELFFPKVENIQAISYENIQTESRAKKFLERCTEQFNARNNLVNLSLNQKPDPTCFYQGQPIFSYKDRLDYLMRSRQSIEAAYLESVKNVKALNEQKQLLDNMETLRSKVNRVNLNGKVNFRINLKDSKASIITIDQELLTTKQALQAEIDRQTVFQNDAIEKLKEFPAKILSDQNKLNQLDLIKNKLMNSKPFKKLVEHMPRSTKFAQITNYLYGIQSAGSIAQLIMAVKADLKNVSHHGVYYNYEKSMRENTMHDLYGFFHAGRSKTETHALELEDLLYKILGQVYPAHADEEKHVRGKKF